MHPKHLQKYANAKRVHFATDYFLQRENKTGQPEHAVASILVRTALPATAAIFSL